ncbi:MAG TPA: TPM domain-containing protein [Candidatus Sulfomarinibacteraceae bacterium]|nr:TPM domain-containing protein [Candidatus Sulfomarinibacteraceae bacterium]
MPDVGRLFTEADRAAIADAARRAEGATSGEIVPYIVGVCDSYPLVVWKAAALGALTGLVGGEAVHLFGGFWGGSVWLWVVLPALVGALFGPLAARLSGPLRRWLIGERLLELRARQRAAAAFLEEQVFATRDRTGILILVALFEHQVVVLGDAGINRAVPDGAWEGVVSRVVSGIRDGRPSEALIAAIGDCGRLLEEHRLKIRPDDVDELDNRPRVRDR